MKAFALAAAAVLLLAGSAAAQGPCLNVPTLYCATCASSPNDGNCGTCLATEPVSSTPIVPVDAGEYVEVCGGLV